MKRNSDTNLMYTGTVLARNLWFRFVPDSYHKQVLNLKFIWIWNTKLRLTPEILYLIIKWPPCITTSLPPYKVSRNQDRSTFPRTLNAAHKEEQRAKENHSWLVFVRSPTDLTSNDPRREREREWETEGPGGKNSETIVGEALVGRHNGDGSVN